MGKIYKGQIGVLIELDTGDLMVGATVQEILYKVGNKEGAWTAVQDGTKLTYTTTTAELVVGTYFLQAHVVALGLDLLGTTAHMVISKKWS
jgi:predicted secreted protein